MPNTKQQNPPSSGQEQSAGQHIPQYDPESQAVNIYCKYFTIYLGAESVLPEKKVDLICCVPEPAGGCPLPLQLHQAVRVICSNVHCSQSHYMHDQCFIVWEESVLNFIKSRGRARGWTQAQRKINLWTRKGYELAYKACNCLCGHGYLRKDVDWRPPAQSSSTSSDKTETKKKKKRREKTNLRPKLNYSTREVRGHVDQLHEDMGDTLCRDKQSANTSEKVRLVPSDFRKEHLEEAEVDGWDDQELRPGVGGIVRYVDPNRSTTWI